MSGGAPLLPALLRACCRRDGEPPEPRWLEAAAAASPAEWERAAAVLASHRLLPLAGHALGAALLARAPAPFADAVRAEFRATFVRNTFAMRGLEQVLAALQAVGIEPVVLKGAALVNSLYPALAARPMADLDLLVEAGERERAAAALDRLGFRRAAQEEDAGNFVGADGLRVDLVHRFRLFEGRPRASLTEAVAPRFVARDRIVVFEPNALLVHLVVHMNGHRGDVGHLLAWLVDAALVLREHGARLARARLAPLLDGDAAWTWLVRTVAFARDVLGVAAAAELARELPACPPLTLAEVLRSRRARVAAGAPARLLARCIALASDRPREARARRVVAQWRRAAPTS